MTSMNLLRATLVWLPLLGHTPPSDALAAADLQAAALDAPGRVAYDQAVSAFRAGRYPAAYGLFARLADTGHVASARLALVMYDHGAVLFGRAWYATPDQQRRWNALVINSSRERVARIEGGASD